MKKSFISLGLMLSAMFTLTNCAKELDAPIETPEQEGTPYEIIASVDPSTKTANEGLSTQWVANDALNVFYAEAGSTAYSNNCKFTVSDVATGRFTGNLDAAKPLAASNDWYVIYPYNKYVKTPASTSGGYMTICSKSNESQLQDGLDNMKHIAGYNYPIYGVAKASSSQEIPSIKMKHATSVLKVVVTNNSGAELPVNSVKFTAPEKISGKFFLDVTKEPIVFTPNKYDVSETAALDVVNATIPVDGEAAFYLAVKPFHANSQDLVIEVNGYAKTIKAATTTFVAGKIKTLNFNYDQKPPIYSTGFDYKYNNSTQYNSADETVGTDIGATTSWGITYGNWKSDNSAQMRSYADNPVGEKGSLYMKFDVAGVTEVTYKAMSNNSNLSLNTYFSTDSGLSWVAVDTKKALTTSLTEYTISIPGKPAKLRVKFSANINAQIKGELTIDDVNIYGTGEILGVTDLAVPYNVNTSVDDKTVTVTWEDVKYATSYTVKCGTKTVDVAQGVKTASITMDAYGTYPVTITAKADGYTSAVTPEEKVTLVDPNAESPYVKVTSMSQIVAGGKYYLASPTHEIFNGKISKGHLQASAGAAELDGKYSNIPTDAVVLTLVADGSNFKLKYATDNLYITATKAGSGGFGLVSQAENPISWTITYGTAVKIKSGAGFGTSGKDHCEFRTLNGTFRSYKDPSTSGDVAVLIQILN